MNTVYVLYIVGVVVALVVGVLVINRVLTDKDGRKRSYVLN